MVTIFTGLNTIGTISGVLKFDAATTQGQRLLKGSDYSRAVLITLKHLHPIHTIPSYSQWIVTQVIELKLAPVCSTIQYAQLGIMLTAYNNEKISSHLVYRLITFVNLALIKLC